jgi:hypothetical protein
MRPCPEPALGAAERQQELKINVRVATLRNATPVPGLRPEPVAPFGAAVVARVRGFYGSGMADGFSERYRDLLTGSYDCVDRIVLNAYFPLAQSGRVPGVVATLARRQRRAAG